MATQTPPIVTRLDSDLQEIKIVSHSNLFYWWPFWAVGFILFLLTYFDGHLMAIVPEGTTAYTNVTVLADQKRFEDRDVLMTPQGKQLPRTAANGPPRDPHLRMARNTTYGVIYLIVLILLIVITNVPLRGMWSVAVIMTVVFMTIILALAHWWEPILDAMRQLHIHINAAGYLLISATLFVIWLITVLLFDPQVYMVFTPGQLACPPGNRRRGGGLRYGGAWSSRNNAMTCFATGSWDWVPET